MVAYATVAVTVATVVDVVVVGVGIAAHQQALLYRATSPPHAELAYAGIVLDDNARCASSISSRRCKSERGASTFPPTTEYCVTVTVDVGTEVVADTVIL